MKKGSYVIFGAVVVVVVLAIFLFRGMGNVGASGELDTFAQCLTDSGAKMYGAYWCGHCKNQKEAFGSSFDYIDYVECDPRGDDANPEACDAAGVTGYPTWIFADGEKAPGERPLDYLASKTGCALPA